MSFHSREPPNSEADTLIIAEAREPICVGLVDRPNRPHISSDFYQCQRARGKNEPEPPFLWRFGPLTSEVFLTVCFGPFPSRRFRRPVAVCSASVRGVLRIPAGVRKRIFRETVIFFIPPNFCWGNAQKKSKKRQGPCPKSGLFLPSAPPSHDSQPRILSFLPLRHPAIHPHWRRKNPESGDSGFQRFVETRDSGVRRKAVRACAGSRAAGKPRRSGLPAPGAARSAKRSARSRSRSPSEGSRPSGAGRAGSWARRS